jgi:hypothetical protein
VRGTVAGEFHMSLRVKLPHQHGYRIMEDSVLVDIFLRVKLPHQHGYRIMADSVLVDIFNDLTRFWHMPSWLGHECAEHSIYRFTHWN